MTIQTEKPVPEAPTASYSVVEAAREGLKAAHGALIDAQYALEMATAASQRARAFVEGATERRDKFREIDRVVAVERSTEIKADLLAGRAPTFTDAPALSRNARDLIEAESRVAAAEIASADLMAAEGEAQADLNRARDEVRAAADAVLIAMAHAVAQEVEALEAHAVELRVSLGGGSFAPIATALRGATLSPAVMRVLASTDLMEFPHNSPKALAVKAAARGWLALIEQLMSDPDAELRLDDEPQQMAAE